MLCAAMLFLPVLLSGCTEKKSESLSIGLGIYTSAEAENATVSKNGGGTVTSTAAAVLVDSSGKIVSCFLDVAENQISYTASGEALADDKFLTKREQGDGYGMKTHGGASLEWYEQADVFERACNGKTIDEIKALVASDGKGSDEVIRAGCTIDVSDFVKAITKAVANATPSAATRRDTLKLGAATVRTAEDATINANGKNQTDTTFFAAAVDPTDHITAAYSDCVEVEFSFNAAGISENSGQWTILSKREAGDAYGMKTYGGASLEWYEQASTFDRACIGKKSAEISSLLGKDGYGIVALQTAGCTILVNDFVKAASKIG